MEYKYWLYYLINDNGSNELYAYTDDKNIAKQFESSRNLSKFIKVKKELTSQEVNFLAVEYRPNILREYELTTRSSFFKVKKLSIVTTELEFLTVSNISIRLNISDIDTMKLDISSLLEESGQILNSKINKSIEFMYDSDGTYIVDDFKLFLMYFGETMI